MSALEAVVAQRRWLRRAKPFPHVVAHDVFTPDFQARLTADFCAVLARGVQSGGEAWDGERFVAASSTRLSCLLTPRSAQGALGLFLSRAWHDFVGGLFGIEGTGEVSAALHHHLPGSPSGTPHNDLNPGWFPDRAPEDRRRIVVADPAECDYVAAAPSRRGVHRSIRAVAVIFYLANGPSWTAEDGGATGLYDGIHDPVDAPAARVLPLDNALVAFACTPWSFHSYMTNPRRPRSSVVMWIHAPLADAVKRWGASAIVPWAAANASPRRAP